MTQTSHSTPLHADADAPTRRDVAAADHAASRRTYLRAAIPPLRRLLPGLLSGIAMGIATVALMATSAWLITRAAEQPPVLYLTAAAVSVRAFALARAVFRYLERLRGHDAVLRTLADVRVGVIDRLIPRVPARANTSHGSVLSAVVNDVDELQNLTLRVLHPIVVSCTVGILTIAGLVWIRPGAGLVIGFVLVAVSAAAVWGGSRLATASERSLAPRRAALAEALHDYISGLPVLSHYGAEPDARREVLRADADLTRAALRRASAAGLMAGLFALGSAIAVALAIVTGRGIVDAPGGGPLFAVLVLTPLAVFEVLAAVPLAWGHLRVVSASADRLAEVAPNAPRSTPAQESPAAQSSPTAPSSPTAQDDRSTHITPSTDVHDLSARRDDTIELNRVDAGWPRAAHDALSHLSLRVMPGECVVIEGESGAGKSTLAALLVGFISGSGEYRIGGVPASPPEQVRQIVGLCEQRPYLFDETIRQNLLFAHDAASEEDLWQVLDRVGLAEWTRTRGGLDAPVGERGRLVSGGQAQRIALARALLRGFPVLVLDEPTANVDPERADAVLRDVVSTARSDGRSVIVLTHDRVADDLVDRRYLLRDGALQPRNP